MANKSKTSVSHILFLVSGVILLIYYLLSQGMPSVGGDLLSLMKFIVELFTLVLLIGFYFFFLFEGKNCAGVAKSIAPSLLILIVVGAYSMNFGSAEANAIISGIATMCYLLIIVTGFVFLFIHNKLIGLVFSFSSVVYAAFVTLSYVIVLIISLVNGGSFSLAKLFETLCYVVALGLLFVGGYQLTKNKDWSLQR